MFTLFLDVDTLTHAALGDANEVEIHDFQEYKGDNGDPDPEGPQKQRTANHCGPAPARRPVPAPVQSYRESTMSVLKLHVIWI